ncbi:ABC transporter permease [Leuconostoc mesenteroides]|uniref:ABC transporter permease n=1 Tax=Leuconostoc mesenteroides TaxID=1245 RepID=UPI0004612B38|nr:ABC transporter permease [Leuconostoc mesenteroides]KDA51525.1 Teichoic acid translocation permease protein TagG [Leuconostoc mesenteroides subsp. cremoris T26]ORI39047.1 ABC transporter permease [Leuconostoc mesenteroides subsp. cremoris]ORI39713.1 ABC transporter permease [Leuconostoc mesenteroides subsp. cremoris]ORI41947.1 ABC transporter permease [Leuconostoc mesenteroides subsp. cremoris]ORI43379.1 ABC transporter permease [Leuconostoc mesenteroides subsp. cremoris]
MINATKIVWEQLKYFPLIIRMVRYGDQSTYQNFFLGQAWKIINPILQVSVYFVIFGMGLRNVNQSGNTMQYAAWLMVGMAVWRFMDEAIMNGSQAIKRQIGLVTKMKFPLSVLPAIAIASAIWTFIALFILGSLFLLFSGSGLNAKWPWLLYYFFCSVIFSYSFALFNSTIIILIPDYISILRLFMSLGMWIAGVIFKIDNLNNVIGDILRLSPFYYIVYGIRDVWVSPDILFESQFGICSIIFWSLVLIFLITGSYLHLKFKKNFMEYI